MQELAMSQASNCFKIHDLHRQGKVLKSALEWLPWPARGACQIHTFPKWLQPEVPIAIIYCARVFPGGTLTRMLVPGRIFWRPSRSSALRSLFVFFLLAASALADSQVTMKFLGHGGSNKNPVYPWYLQVDGVPATLICDTALNVNVRGETWKANVTNILNGPTQGLFKGNTLLAYKAAAVIFSDILFHGADPGDANWAIWALFTPSVKNNPHFNADAQALYNAALALAPHLPKSFFKNYVMYTPIADTQSCYPKCGLPQEFIGYNPVPEPETLSLFGIGLVILAGTIRKKMVGSS